MQLNKSNPFIYHFPEHNLWAYFASTYNSTDYLPKGAMELCIDETPLRSESINGRNVTWYGSKPTVRARFVVTPIQRTGYRRDPDAPTTLPEFVTEAQLDPRLADCYTAVYSEGVYRFEPFEVPTITLDRAPGPLKDGWESQLPYRYLIDPICAASAPCALPWRLVWQRVVTAARDLVRSTPGLCVPDDYENIGHISIGKVTADGKRIRTRSFVNPEGRQRNYGGSDTVYVDDIHAANLAEGEAALTTLLVKLQEAAQTPTRTCPRCDGCGEIGFNEPDVKNTPAPVPPRRRR